MLDDKSAGMLLYKDSESSTTAITSTMQNRNQLLLFLHFLFIANTY